MSGKCSDYRGAITSANVIYKGYVYSKMQADGKQEGGGDCMFVRVELATGKLQGLGNHTDSHASMVAGDGMMFYEGYFHRVTQKFALLANMDWLKCGDNSVNYANSHTPPYVEGRLYVKGHNSIRCLDLRAGK